MTIWQFNTLLANRLRNWNVLNVLVGVLLLLRKPFWRGFGGQNIGWGMINLAIADFGSYFTHMRYEKLVDPLQPAVQAKEAQNLRRILWVNTFLDVFYMLGGYRLAQTRGAQDEYWRGAGWGIVLQAALLFIFDLIHALRVPQTDS